MKRSEIFFVAVAVLCVVATNFSLAAECYVSPTGKDDHPGTRDAPFQTLEKARNFLREMRATQAASEPATVFLLPGRYHRTESFRLEKQDSGSENARVTFRSTEPFGAELIGGRTIPASAFQKVDDKQILERLDKSIRSKILVADLNVLDITMQKQWGDSFKGRPTSPPELFLNDSPMTVARWPDEGWAGFKTMLDDGMPHGENAASEIADRAEKAGVRFMHPDVDVTKKHGGAFVYDEGSLKIRDPRRFARWRVEDGVWLCGYWTHDWADDVLRVASIDAAQKILVLKGIHGYGIGGHSWTGYSERRFFALNLLEELDAPGEWYLDRGANRLYFYPPKKLTEKDSIVLSMQEKPLVELSDASFIRFEGLSLGPVFTGGMNIQGGSNCEILGCRIRNTGTHGIHIDGGKTHTVRSCDLYNIGSVGVSIYAGDRKTLTPAGHVAENNHIHHFGRLQRTYAGAFALHGVGNTVRNNKIHDAPHLAISYGGNENRIQRNEIYHVVQETSDAGALYTGRDWTTQGNLIEENFIRHLGTSDSHGTMGVYLDDCDSGDTIRGNLFYKASRAVFIGGGRDNTVRNNLFIDCYQGIALDARGMTWKQWNTPGDGWNLEEKAENLNYKKPPWSERYPKLAATMLNEPKAPLGCVFETNVMIDCKQWMHLDGDVLKLLARTDLKDNIVVANNLVVENTVKTDTLNLPEKQRKLHRGEQNVDPGFMNPDKLNFRFKTNSQLKKILPEGFEPIPVDKIGLQTDEFRKKL